MPFIAPVLDVVLFLTPLPFAALFPSFLKSAIGTYGLYCRQALRPQFLWPYRPTKAFTLLYRRRHLLRGLTVLELHSDWVPRSSKCGQSQVVH